MTPSEVPATRANVDALAARLELDETALHRVRRFAGLMPDRDDWLRYLDRFLIAAGTLLIVAGITAFFAWNWAELHRLIKFALIQGGLAGAVLLAWRLGIDTAGGRASLLAAAFLAGVLLAVFGQVYQTGADPHGLFLAWALLILPWALVGRQAGLWLLWLALLNLVLILYWIQVLHPPFGGWQVAQLLGPLVWLSAMVMDWRLASWLFALNATAIVVWELSSGRGISWLQGRWFPRLTALVALYTVTAPTLLLILAAGMDSRVETAGISPLLFGGALAACLWYYQYRKPDLFMLTAVVFGAILVVMAFAIRHLFDGVGSLLVLALLLIAQVAAAAWWLRYVARRRVAGA